VPALKEFLNERWRGVQPLLWDMPLIQSELREALYCGLCSLELAPDDVTEGIDDEGLASAKIDGAD
jgi:glycerol-3-phosphate dehydrogenase